ncbi:MAG: SIMPL domain-containing protein [Anaerolineales bacterium]
MTRYMNFHKTLALGGLVAALAISGCNVQNQGEGVSTDEASTRESISVSGFGEAVGEPDMASVELGVESEADDVATAIDLSNETVERVTQALIGAGLAASDIQSTHFNVWREEGFDRLTGQPTDETTFHVDSTVRIKIRDIDQISSMIQTGLDAGATNVFGLTFGIDDTSALEAEARLLALEDAIDRAQQLADALGMTLGQPLVVNELAGGSLLGAGSEAALLRGIGAGGGGPPISPGELTVGVQVDVMYAVDN